MEIKGGRKEKIRGLVCRTIECLKGKGGSGVPMAAAVTLALLVIFAESASISGSRLLQSGKGCIEDAIISVVNDNYAGVYHGVRRGIFRKLSALWGGCLGRNVGYRGCVRTAGQNTWDTAGWRQAFQIYGDEQTEEFALDGLEVTIRNAPFAPSDPSGTQRFEAEGITGWKPRCVF